MDLEHGPLVHAIVNGLLSLLEPYLMGDAMRIEDP